MLKFAVVSLFGLAVMAWLDAGPPQMFASDPPPTIRAQPGPIKIRPGSDVAGQPLPRARPIAIEQDTGPTTAIDANLILPR